MMHVIRSIAQDIGVYLPSHQQAVHYELSVSPTRIETSLFFLGISIPNVLSGSFSDDDDDDDDDDDNDDDYFSLFFLLPLISAILLSDLCSEENQGER